MSVSHSHIVHLEYRILVVFQTQNILSSSEHLPFTKSCSGNKLVDIGSQTVGRFEHLYKFNHVGHC